MLVLGSMSFPFGHVIRKPIIHSNIYIPFDSRKRFIRGSIQGESIDECLKFLYVYAKTIPNSHRANKSMCDVYHVFLIFPIKIYMLSLVSIKSLLKNQMIFMAMSGT